MRVRKLQSSSFLSFSYCCEIAFVNFLLSNEIWIGLDCSVADSRREHFECRQSSDTESVNA